MKTKSTFSVLRDFISADQLSLNTKDSNYTARLGFFYRHGGSAERFRESITTALTSMRDSGVLKSFAIVDSGEVYTAFKGGAPISKQSHWWVKFTAEAA